ncbi:RNA pseudouridine synthase 2, chloroplastic isoform X1 [Rhododendron vialii]|uniref:RNA pseudouridine synthase 2, chloroplastic isoform X1 n=2 Tax=Rhododendron vialii TaxID=182163 RepID=UPI00265E4E64|nr:RNA pseudouridine synthase 2, chloroplastic isoform X1 [Rhododendron vialii]
MLSLLSLSTSSLATLKSLHASSSSSLSFFPSRNPRSFSSTIRACSASSSASDSDEPHELHSGRRRTSYAGVRLDGTVDAESGKIRLDSWISSRINGVSRARVQSSIRTGLVSVNGRVIDKVSHMVRDGDEVECTISELQPLKAEPEDIPLDIVYEDEHVLVVNKPAHMVVHPAPGNATGTLVNGILHHCSLSTFAFPNQEVLSEMEDISDDEFSCFSPGQSGDEDVSSVIFAASVRPGIVHRLDKGTSGLLVVAKDEHSHSHLAEQFKQHTIHRVYISLTCGVPSPLSGRVDIPIGRDLNNRIRMTAVPGPSKCGHARHAASRYRVLEILAGGGSALVEWRLETGRTHQIRAHAKYLGIPLLGDEVYGGTANMAMSGLRPRTPSYFHGQLMQLVSQIKRPCLHALALGFRHPHTRENTNFSCIPPVDFAETLSQLRDISFEKVKTTSKTF